jgi:hypothetical protein
MYSSNTEPNLVSIHNNNLLMHVELPSLTHIRLQLITFNALPITSIYFIYIKYFKKV